MREAVESKGFSVAKIKREYGEQQINDALQILVLELVESFNVGKTMNTQQVNKVVETIKTDYYYLKISELKFIFSEASKGRYGQLFDRIDLAIICGWIDQYVAGRDEIVTDQRLAEQKYQATVTPDENTPVISFATILADLKKKEIEELRDEVVDRNLVDRPKREPTEQELIVQDIFKEFETLYRDQEEKREELKIKGRFVKHADQWLSIEGFLRIKLEENGSI